MGFYYNPNTSYCGTALVQVLTNRARAAVVPAGIFGGLALLAQGFFSAGQAQNGIDDSNPMK